MLENNMRGLPGRNAVPGVRKKRARCAAAVTTALLAAAILVPTQAFAASSVYIEGADHAAGSTYSGTGWTWDGADGLTLNGYDGGCIYAIGDLDINVTGNNTVTADPEVDLYQEAISSPAIESTGALTISGAGTLTANSTTPAGSRGDKAPEGIYATDVTINGATVNVYSDAVGTAVR